jgi:hypothetical protein
MLCYITLECLCEILRPGGGGQNGGGGRVVGTNGKCCKNSVRRRPSPPRSRSLRFLICSEGGKSPTPLFLISFFLFLSSLIYDDRLMANIDFALNWKSVWESGYEWKERVRERENFHIHPETKECSECVSACVF